MMDNWRLTLPIADFRPTCLVELAIANWQLAMNSVTTQALTVFQI
jgi:hypothetical protein